MPLLPIILAGGCGRRMAPQSSAHKPKQFHHFASEYSYLQQAILRAKGVTEGALLIVANQQHWRRLQGQIDQIKANVRVLLEPCQRNTAPAVAVAAIDATSDGQDPLLLIMPSDHRIQDQAAFNVSIALAQIYAEQQKLVCFGVTPNSPNAQYGYIKRGEMLPETAAVKAVYSVIDFIEKPSAKIAQAFLESTDYFWNSGIYLIKATLYLSLLKTYQPQILYYCQRAYRDRTAKGAMTLLSHRHFKDAPAISIDYAVVEKMTQRVLVPLQSDWMDIGG